MNEPNDLDCRIYVDASVTLSELSSEVAGIVSGAADGTQWTKVISLPPGEIDILENDEFDEEQRKQHPDGFLFYRYYVEFYAPSQGWPEARVAVAKVLEHLWSQGYAAVAACSYEDELPNKGKLVSPQPAAA